MSVFESMTPAQRVLRARTAVHTSWAHTPGPAARRARTANGTAAFLARFEREADPDGVMSPEDRARAAESLKQAYMARLSLKASQAKAAKRQSEP